MHRVLSAHVVTVCIVLLSACGGAPPPAEATAPTAPQLALEVVPPKSLDFSWSDVDLETSYRLLERPAGASAFVRVAEIASDSSAFRFDVFLSARTGASYVLQACNDVGCSESNTVSVSDAFARPIAYLKASNTDADDEFGWAVALSGDGRTLAVGAHFEDSSATGVDGIGATDGALDSGAAYVFVLDADGAWTQQAYLKASNTDPGDRFGWAVALSDDGDTLAVSAVFEDGIATGVGGDETSQAAPDSGAAYVFTRSDAGVWSQQAYVKASNTGAGDTYGASVALSGDGDTLVVGANFEDGSAAGDGSDDLLPNSGAAYVYVRTGATWAFEAYLKASDAAADTWFAQALAISRDGSTLAVGSNRQHDPGVATSGAAYVFRRTGSNWSEEARLAASNPGFFDLFGGWLALSSAGDVLAVSGWREDGGATGIDGDESDDSATDAGAVYVYRRAGTGTWTQEAYVKASNTGAGHLFGVRLALSGDGDTLAIGASGEASAAQLFEGDQSDTSAPGAGAVFVFMRNEAGDWSQKAYVKAPNARANANFGVVALSEDGRTLAVGAPREASGATGVDGDASDTSAPGAGAIYVY
ncbi:hypothetical protein BH23DEI1_BH23DEI1_20420 [soil metagenome]